MMRVATAWAVLLGVSGCMGVHEDLGAGGADPSLSALSTADSGTKNDDVAPTPAPGLPANCTQEAEAAGTDDVYSRCVTRAKTCYEYEPDTRICEAHMRGCDTLLTTKPTVPPPPAAEDAYTACVRKAKECYNGANDPADCDANWKICDALKKAPDPAEVAAQRKADYAGCLDKAKLCYGYEKDTKICDEQRASCELVFAADPS